MEGDKGNCGREPPNQPSGWHHSKMYSTSVGSHHKNLSTNMGVRRHEKGSRG